MSGRSGALKTVTLSGLWLSGLLLLSWPFLVIPGVMSLAAAPTSAQLCTGSWWGASLCTSTFYPLLYCGSGGLAWLLRKRGAARLAVVMAWAPFLLFASSALLSGVAGTVMQAGWDVANNSSELMPLRGPV